MTLDVAGGTLTVVAAMPLCNGALSGVRVVSLTGTVSANVSWRA